MRRGEAPAIAIIGAGFSGSLLAVHLLRRLRGNARLLLIEKNAQFGRGLAYSTGNPNHLLNVRASRMSAFADDPDHFLDWLWRSPVARKAVGERPSALTFVPRWLYGAYIQEQLGDEIWRTGRSRNLFLVPDEAVAIRETTGGLIVEMRGGRCYEVDAAVLAIGNFPHEDAAAHYYGNPWSERAFAGLAGDEAVLLIGTGLTMVDSVISLLDLGQRGPIHAVSRRGLLPRRHAAAAPHCGLELAPQDMSTVVALLRRVRREMRAGGDEAAAWRSVIDALRPFTQRIWRTLPEAERRRFLRHLRPWWEVHRHRMAPEVADVIDRTIAAGQLRLRRAHIERMAADEGGVSVTLRPRGVPPGAAETLRVARVIDCSGPQCDYARIDAPLVRSLLAHGLARPDPLGLGLEVTLDAAVVGRSGAASPRLYALGPVTRGVFWEITSVPDIREQCWRLAALLEARLAQRALEPVAS